MNEFDKTTWVAQAKQLLDDSTRDLDAATASRLNRARQAALAQRVGRAPRQWWVPAGLASACGLLLAVAIWQPRMHTAPGNANATNASAAAAAAVGDNAATGDSESADDSLEFYQDLDFYAWLDAQSKDSDG